jgi:hypothetical protein
VHVDACTWAASSCGPCIIMVHHLTIACMGWSCSSHMMNNLNSSQKSKPLERGTTQCTHTCTAIDTCPHIISTLTHTSQQDLGMPMPEALRFIKTSEGQCSCPLVGSLQKHTLQTPKPAELFPQA